MNKLHFGVWGKDEITNTKKNQEGVVGTKVAWKIRLIIQIWFYLFGEKAEDSIFDSCAMRSFMHIDFNAQQVPDAVTLLKFKHMLELKQINLAKKYLLMSTGVSTKLDLRCTAARLVDTSLIAALKLQRNKIANVIP